MVTHTYPRSAGDPTAPFVESIAEAVARRGHDVDVVLPETPGLAPREVAGVRPLPYRYAPTQRLQTWGYGRAMDERGGVRLGMYALTPLVAAALRRRVLGLLRTGSYDVLHVHWVVPNAVLLAGATRDVPMVVTLHGSDISLSERSRLARLPARRALERAGVVTAPSADLARRAASLGARPGSTRVVPYGVDTDVFSPERAVERASWRERLGVDERSVLILAVGRLQEVKGFAYLVDAAAKVEGVSVAIAGGGDLKPELEERIRASHAPVRLVGPLDRDSVADAFAAADLVAVPSVVDSKGRVDGLPNTLLEAMSSGRAVIASRVGGVPDAVEHDVNGLLVPQRDAAALASALTRLAGDAHERERLGSAARRTILERFTWAAVGEAFERAYASALPRADATSG